MVKWMRYPAGKVNALSTKDWMWFASDDYVQEHKQDNDEEFGEKIVGKYLFFHEDPKVLISVATEEIMHNGFHLAKISKKLLGKNTDYVLCLYYSDDSRKGELAQKYQGKNGIKYRYWKSDE